MQAVEVITLAGREAFHLTDARGLAVVGADVQHLDAEFLVER